MPLELRSGPNPEELIRQAVERARGEASYYEIKSTNAQIRHLGGAHNELGDSDTDQRLASIYQETARALETLYIQHRRSIERAVNPYLEDSDDDRIDKKIQENNPEDPFFNQVKS